MHIRENILEVRGQIARAALSCGRAAEEIFLVAAAKMNPAEKVREAIAAGVDAVGENRVQEMTEKFNKGAYTGTPLHFIGHLQKNKVKQVVGKCDLIESADSKELMALIQIQAEKLAIVQDVLIEVNIGKESAKSGIFPEMLPELIVAASDFSNLRIRGLMAIPPASDVPSGNRRYFMEMYKLFVDIKEKKYDNVIMDYLSMGMSDDFIDAILEGANMVRLGSKIFGARNNHE